MNLSELNILDIGNKIQLAGAVYRGEHQGKDHTFICMFPDEMDGSDTQLVFLNMNRTDWDKFVRQTDLLETEMIQKGADGVLTKVVVRKSTRQIEQNVSWKVYKRDSYACRYCGVDDAPLTVDHLVCWEEGGPSNVENLVSACRACNRTRGNLKYGDWLKHPYYLKRAEKLSASQRYANEKLLPTLDTIPRVVHKRAR